MTIKTKISGAVLLFALAVAPSVNATEILTTTFSAWKGTINSGSASEWSFNPAPGNASFNTAQGYNLNINSASYGTTVVTGPDNGSYYLTGNQQYQGGAALQSANDGSGEMLFTAPGSGYTAFLFGIGEYGNTANPITLSLSDGETFTVNPTLNGVTYLGLSSATQITSFVLSTTSGSQVELTDFFVGNSNQPANVPTAPAAEVTTALMIGSGLLLFGARRKVFSNFTRTQAQA